MRGRSMTIKGYFDVSGQERMKRHMCSFSTDMTCPEPELTLHCGDRVVATPSDAELKRTRPKPLTGRIDSRNAVGAKLQFVRTGSMEGLSGSTLVAECVAGQGGGYAAFVPPGEYDVHVYAGKEHSITRGLTVAGGLRQHWWITVDGLPQTHVVDQVTFADSDWVLITGAVVAADGHEVAGAQVLVTAGKEVHAYVETDAAGRYTFALRRGVYDVRFTAPGSPTKLVTGVQVDGVTPWCEQLAATGLLVTRHAALELTYKG